MCFPVEFGAEELQEASLTEERVMQSGSNEPNRGWPLERFDAVAYPQLQRDISTKEGLRPSGQRDGTLLGVGKINPQRCRHRIAENGVISAGVQQTVA